MVTRIKDAFSKLIFCYKISADKQTFLKLIRETKKFKRSGFFKNETSELYHFSLKNGVKDVYLRTHSGDIAMLYEIFWREVYRLPDDVFKNVKTIVDLGANIGMASLFFGEISPLAKIFAVEPEEDNFGILVKNLQNPAQFTPLQIAINDTEGEVSLLNDGMSYNVQISQEHNPGKQVRAVTMNTLLKENNIKKIDLLKIDIEGTEKKIFAAETDWLDFVEKIIIEFHSAEDKEICTKALTLKGFTLLEIKTGNAEGNLFFAQKNDFKSDFAHE